MTYTRTSFKKPKEKLRDARLSVYLEIIKMGERNMGEEGCCRKRENGLLEH